MRVTNCSRWAACGWMLAVVGAMIAGSAIAQTQASHDNANKKPGAKKTHEEIDGERVFAENCARCHAAPDGFSQHISGTVVRHMRVRASLSEQDEKALMRFFNP